MSFFFNRPRDGGAILLIEDAITKQVGTMKARIFSSMIALLVLVGPLYAQESAEMKSQMDKLSFMLGDWEGDAWSMTREGRVDLRQSEHVEMRLGGAIMMVEGTGRELDESGIPGEIVFNAVAVISPSDSADYKMHSWLLDGRSGEFDLVLTDTGYKWTLPTPYGTTRYFMELNADGEWYEWGEFSRDKGVSWTRVFEMRLTRMR